MVFSSITFLFIFLPAVILCYFLIPQKHRQLRNGILLLFSLFFYFVGEPKYLALMLVSIAANYVFALLISICRSKQSATMWMILSVIFNVGIISVFKYTDFFISNVNSLLGISLPLANIVLPVGISFFTLQGMSYVFDVYMKNVPVQKNILYVATYISLFPQLVAGPIVRYETIAEELTDRNENLNDLTEGIICFVYGLSKKMLIANTLGEASTAIFAAPSSERGAPLAWLGAICYSLHIFFDFSGYSDMAIGMGRMFGFNFLENFNYPYISKSVTEFWRRWHISLSTWFRDYLYIPLGGNRKGKARQIINILVVWSLTGFWHGASWNFVLWGLYFALVLIIEKFFLAKLLAKLPSFISHIYALFMIMIGWVIFNCTSLSDIAIYLKDMFSLATASSNRQFVYYLMQYKVELVLGIIFSMPIAKIASNKLKGKPVFELLRRSGALVLFVFCILYTVSTSFNPFIYFRF